MNSIIDNQHDAELSKLLAIEELWQKIQFHKAIRRSTHSLKIALEQYEIIQKLWDELFKLQNN